MKTLKELKYDKSEIERKMKDARYDYRHEKIDKYTYDDIYLPLVSEFRKVEREITKEEDRLKKVEESKRNAKKNMKENNKNKGGWGW